MRIVIIFLFLPVVMFACGPAKKVAKVQPVISKADTTASVVVLPTKKTDSVTSAKDIFEKVIKNKIDFATFSAKARLQYQGKEGGDDATVYVRVKKDSMIWLSFRGALGIEGARILVTKDSVKVLDLLKKNVLFRGNDYLQEITDIPLDFVTLQDLIVGNPVFIDTNIVSQKVNADNELQVLMEGKVFKNLVSLDNSTGRIMHSKLEDVVAGRNRTCDIALSDYENSAGVSFAKARKISIAEQSKLDINLDFKQYSFNQPLTFPFNIPKNYKRL